MVTILLLTSCGNSNTPKSSLTPTPTATPTVTQSTMTPSVPISTSTPAPTPTPSLTLSPIPTPTPTPTPITTQTLPPTVTPTLSPAATSAPTSTVIPTLVSIVVTAPTNLALGSSQQMTATGKYSDSSTKDLTAEANWHSSRPDVAVVVPGGFANTLIIGSTNITASVGNIVSPEVTVMVNALLSLKVTPNNPSVSVGQTLQLTATGIYSGGFTQDLTTKARWLSFNTLMATVSEGGLVTGMAPGYVNITATVGLLTSPITILTVTPAQK
jgi:hypothetical protein